MLLHTQDALQHTDAAGCATTRMVKTLVVHVSKCAAATCLVFAGAAAACCTVDRKYTSASLPGVHGQSCWSCCSTCTSTSSVSTCIAAPSHTQLKHYDHRVAPDSHDTPLHNPADTKLLDTQCRMWWCHAELKAQEGYNARERRALAVRGGHSPGIDAVPLPTWMSGSQAAGRGGGSELCGSGVVFAEGRMTRRCQLLNIPAAGWSHSPRLVLAAHTA